MTHRFKAVATVVTSLMIASGCRSAAVNSGSTNNGSAGSVGSPPFYRSFERSPRPYDDSYDSPGSSNPPSILPVPGASESEVPPPPSAQRSKWDLIRSGFKMPSMSRQTNQVNQTAAKTTDQGLAQKSEKRGSLVPTSQEENNDLEEQVVLPRSSVKSQVANLAPPVSMETPASESNEIESDDIPVVTPRLRAPINTRYGVIQPWPSNRSLSRIQANNPDRHESSSSANTVEADTTVSTGEVPLLLPPTP